MRLIFFFAAIFSGFVLSAQQDSLDRTAPYAVKPAIPAFDLLEADSITHLTRDNLNLHHRTIIMFFSPECTHCQHQTEDLIAGMDSLKEIQIVMATYQPFGEMVDFTKKYQLSKYPNIKVGRDINYFFPPFYRMRSLPHLALYDRNGNYFTSFEGNQKIATLVSAFEKKDHTALKGF